MLLTIATPKAIIPIFSSNHSQRSPNELLSNKPKKQATINSTRNAGLKELLGLVFERFKK